MRLYQKGRKMKLQNAVKLLKEFGEVKEDECGASFKANGYIIGAHVSFGRQEVSHFYVDEDKVGFDQVRHYFKKSKDFQIFLEHFLQKRAA